MGRIALWLREQVPTDLQEVFKSTRRSIVSFDDNRADPDYERHAFHLAVWVHAEIVRIHPFEDGNGRSARAMMNWVLARLDLRPIAIEVPKQEYRDALNHYYQKGDLQVLLDLALALYPVG